MKKWRCTVCGYIHQGEEPPVQCPVCKAPRDDFVEVIGEEAEQGPESVRQGKAASEEPVEPTPLYGMVSDLLYKNHAHPISVHFPNGALPVAVVFVILAVFLNHAGLGWAAYYNLIFVALVMPMVLFSGYVSWHKRYKGARTPTFVTKIVCGIVVLLALVVLLAWRLYDPEVLVSANRWLFLLVHLIMLGAAGTAGHLGGKLVFGKR